MKTLSSVAVFVLALGAPLAAGAFPGDHRIIEGTLVWPQDLSSDRVLSGERVALVQGDLGTRFFADLTATTDVPAPIKAGHRVVLVGREGLQNNQIVADRLEARAPQAARTAAPTPVPPAAPGGAPAGRISLEGSVAALSGSTLILKTRDGQSVAVDVSAVEAPVRDVLVPGREISVYGVVVQGAVLAAQGVQLDYAPSALPGAAGR